MTYVHMCKQMDVSECVHECMCVQFLSPNGTKIMKAYRMVQTIFIYVYDLLLLFG